MDDKTILEADARNEVRDVMAEQLGWTYTAYDPACDRCGAAAVKLDPYEYTCPKCYALENHRPMTRRSI